MGRDGILFLAGVTVAYSAEARGNPLLHGVDQHASAMQPGGNMEGKEVRFGIADSALFATMTTDASCGAVNAMHDSFTPLGGMVPLINIMLGEVIFGGVGAGLYGIIVFIILSVFIAGLMVGRTPEYLGKKIEAFDVKDGHAHGSHLLLSRSRPYWHCDCVAVRHLVHHQSRPARTVANSLRLYLPGRQQRLGVRRSNGNTLWYNVSGAFDMLFGRFFMVIPVLAIAGNLARKKIVPESAGTFPVTTPLFTFLLVSVILIVSALTFFPALSLGPILEHLLMHAGKVF